jgi:hypothetical protein
MRAELDFMQVRAGVVAVGRMGMATVAAIIGVITLVNGTLMAVVGMVTVVAVRAVR